MRTKLELSPALVISLVALFVALGGGAYAALGANSVGHRQLKAGAVTTAKIRNGAVSGAKIRALSVTKQKLAPAALGLRVVAYATIDAEGNVESNRSKGLTQSNVSGGYPYPVCLENAPDFRTAMVTPISSRPLYVVSSSVVFDNPYCPAAPDADLEIDTWVEARQPDEDPPLPRFSQEAFTVVLLK